MATAEALLAHETDKSEYIFERCDLLARALDAVLRREAKERHLSVRRVVLDELRQGPRGDGALLSAVLGRAVSPPEGRQALQDELYDELAILNDEGRLLIARRGEERVYSLR